MHCICQQVTHKPKRDYGHFGHYQKEEGIGLGGENPWFQPPPISPDIPPLFYEDAHKEGNLAEENERLKLLPVVKSLGEQSNPYPNVIHFGTDFGPKLIPLVSGVNGYKVRFAVYFPTQVTFRVTKQLVQNLLLTLM